MAEAPPAQAAVPVPAAAKADPPVVQPPASAPQQGASPGRMAELRVSAHIMTLERGLFCVFPAAGSPPPDPVTGLPGVRITRTPSNAQSANGVAISTFRPDGWLDNSAALVNVTDESAQILVSIYQVPQAGAAPRLQVLRLSGEEVVRTQAPARVEQPAPANGSAPAEQAPAEPVEDPEIVAHVQRAGDVGARFGERIGTPGSQAWIEGFGLAPRGDILPADIEYQGVLGRGWLSPWVEGGKFCGSRGMALPLLGLKIRLKGDAAERFDCSYSATFIDGTVVGPVAMGEACEAESLAALESFQIDITPREADTAPRKQRARPPARAGRR